MMFSMDETGTSNIDSRLTLRQILTQQWVKPGDETHQIYTAKIRCRDVNGNELVTAFLCRHRLMVYGP